jgi:hypothetical protein
VRLAYRGAGKSLARPTSLCISFDGENISFDAGLVIYMGFKLSQATKALRESRGVALLYF